jgi:hypothetical protein
MISFLVATVAQVLILAIIARDPELVPRMACSDADHDPLG